MKIPSTKEIEQYFYRIGAPPQNLWAEKIYPKVMACGLSNLEEKVKLQREAKIEWDKAAPVEKAIFCRRAYEVIKKLEENQS